METANEPQASSPRSGPPAGAGIADPLADPLPDQRYARVLAALLGAVTLAAAPIAASAFAPAGGGAGAHSSPVYLLAQLNHDIGHNDWAFQGGVAGRVSWVLGYAALAVFWLAVAGWMAWHGRRRARAHGTGAAPWLRVLLAAWGAELAAGLLTLAVAYGVDRASVPAGPAVLRAVDLCSPWWSGAAALAAVALRERDRSARRAAAGYGALLAVLLLVPLPGPDPLKALILAAAAAVPAVFAPRRP